MFGRKRYCNTPSLKSCSCKKGLEADVVVLKCSPECNCSSCINTSVMLHTTSNFDCQQLAVNNAELDVLHNFKNVALEEKSTSELAAKLEYLKDES